MAYCSRSDIEELYGARHLEMLLPGDVDLASAVARACAAASALIDGYIGKRYATPLTAIPPLVREYAIDIACWKLAPAHDRLTEQIEKRAKMAMDYFRDVASGKAAIAELETAPGGASGEESAVSSDGAAFSSNGRRWGGEGGMP